jgi:hypothetical protein
MATVTLMQLDRSFDQDGSVRINGQGDAQDFLALGHVT